MQMRKLIILSAVAVAAFFPQARAGEEQQKKAGSTATAPVAEETISLEVKGMT
jgi:hypothetical protein